MNDFEKKLEAMRESEKKNELLLKNRQAVEKARTEELERAFGYDWHKKVHEVVLYDPEREAIVKSAIKHLKFTTPNKVKTLDANGKTYVEFNCYADNSECETLYSYVIANKYEANLYSRRIDCEIIFEDGRVAFYFDNNDPDGALSPYHVGDDGVCKPLKDTSAFEKKMLEAALHKPYGDNERVFPSSPKKGNEKSGGCYVATAVYGSYDCPEVWTLRRYRDNQLAKTWYGRLFIHTYYAISPTLVKWFGDTQWFKNMWKPKLDKMVDKLQKEGVENTPYQDKNW